MNDFYRECYEMELERYERGRGQLRPNEEAQMAIANWLPRRATELSRMDQRLALLMETAGARDMSIMVDDPMGVSRIAPTAEQPETMPPQPEGPPPTQPTPVSLDAEFAQVELEEYRRVATNLRLVSPALDKAEVFAFLKEAGIPVYANGEVGPWMESKMAHWGWKALRKEDEERRTQAVYPEEFKPRKKAYPGYSATFTNGTHVTFGATQYNKPVPLTVLQTAEKIVERFPAAGLFVTDEVTERELWRELDPFLGICVGRTPLIVVAMWDEPGFGIVKT